MNSDSSSKVGHPGPRWPLPAILKVKAARVRYPRPREFVVGRHIVQADSAVEVDVIADADFQARALAPVLHVGDRELTEFRRVGEGHYKYFALGDEDLPAGAPVWWGWGGTGETSGPKLEVAPPPRDEGAKQRPKRKRA